MEVSPELALIVGFLVGRYVTIWADRIAKGRQ